jgi:hypothetical protein
MVLAPPEAELSRLLDEIRKGTPQVSFGIGETVAGGWEEAARQVQVFLNQLQKFIAHYAWVETRVADQFLGRTAVSWAGDMETVWRERLAPEQAVLHQRALALALASRETLIRTIVLAARCAAKLSLLVAVPGAAILVLPAVWKFINLALADLGANH